MSVCASLLPVHPFVLALFKENSNSPDKARAIFPQEMNLCPAVEVTRAIPALKI